MFGKESYLSKAINDRLVICREFSMFSYFFQRYYLNGHVNTAHSRTHVNDLHNFCADTYQQVLHKICSFEEDCINDYK